MAQRCAEAAIRGGPIPNDSSILFVSREPVTRERNGSTAAVANLLALLRSHGERVTVLVTLASSRSPRLLFRHSLDLPEGCTLQVPGYLRLGRWYVRPFRLLPWMRAAVRALGRVPRMHALCRCVERVAGDQLFANTWDLTEPTAREHALVLRAVQHQQPHAVLANYAFWGPVLREVNGPHRAILMHDLLAEHVRLFHASGLPLDCPEISFAQEIGWLDCADTLLAIQQQEAEAVRSRVRAIVVVQPIRLHARIASPTPEPGRCLFVGSNSTPNLQGLAWLLDDVWPQVLAALPTAMLSVVGTVRDRWTRPLPPGVVLRGPVESLADEHDRAAVCLVPLLVGSGLKIKLLEALSHGKATVSTSTGVQGLEAWSADTIAVADTPSEFAAEIVRLLQDDDLRRTRERAATTLVQTYFSAGSESEQILLQRLVAMP